MSDKKGKPSKNVARPKGGKKLQSGLKAGNAFYKVTISEF